MNQENIQDLYTLTATQRAILFHTLYAPETGVYVEQNAYELQNLDVPAYIRAWQTVIERHAALRTGFFWEEVEEPLQMVTKQVDLPLTQLDWQDATHEQQLEQLQALMAAEQERGFDLSTPPLLRLYVIQLDENRHFTLINYHHILYDGWSNIVVQWEAQTYYDAYRQGETAVLPDPTPFREYIAWLRQQDETAAQAYWETYLANFVEATPIPFGAQPTQGVYGAAQAYEEQTIKLPADLAAKLNRFLAQENITYNNFMQAVWGILLNRYSGEDDILFGTIVHGRPTTLPNFERMVGLFINVLPVRLQFKKEESVLAWLKESNRAFITQAQFDYVSLEQIQKWGGYPRERNLFHSLFINNNPPNSNNAPPPDDRQLLFVQEKTNYPLNFYLKPNDDLHISYDPTLFANEVVKRMLTHVLQTVGNILDDPSQQMQHLTILPAAERALLLDEWSNQPTAVSEGSLVADFAQRVAATPDAIAVVDPELGQLTYAELEQRANQLANHLQQAGIQNGRIGVHLHRSIHFPISFWGILKSGNSYVPLDPKHPEQRLAYMIEDAQLETIITHSTIQAELPATDLPLILIDQLGEDTNFTSVAMAETAVILYTSGSTGQPKGVRLGQQGLYNYTHSAIEQFALSSNDNVLQFASLGFDTSLEELCPIQLVGGTLILRTEAALNSVQAFITFCQTHALTVLDLPTAFWHTLIIEMERDRSLQLPNTVHTIIIGGEKAAPEHLATWQQIAPATINLINTYGPSEATVVATACAIAGPKATANAHLAPIGKAVASTELYVVDQYNHPTPVGVPGELLIGGPQVALGYVGREEETAVKFITNPFTENGRLYRTGDRVRFLEDGVLQFVGRTDRQVKIRGFRIEPDTIEHVLNQHEAIADTAVSTQTDVQNNPQIVAYLIPKNGTLPDQQALSTYVRQQLPAYMVPAAFMTVETFPKTNNGKIDYRALPMPNFHTQDSTQYVAPRTPIEETVAELFSELTHVERVGLYDNFFQLGGHSLLITQLASRIQTIFEMELSLRALFENATVIDMSMLIEEKMLEMLEELDEDEIDLLL